MHFYSIIFHPLHYRADITTLAFSTPVFSAPRVMVKDLTLWALPGHI